MFKVKHLWINEKVHNWRENWLNNRKQRVVINGTAADWASVTSGVPQGSIFGPVLFKIYINDLDVLLNNFISKFADDTKIENSIVDDRESLNLKEDLRKISQWSERWEMPFNVNKCHILHVGTRNKNKIIMRWTTLNSMAYNASKILAFRLRQTLNSSSNARMPRLKL